MSAKAYSPEELKDLLLELNKDTPISQLEITLGRPVSGIVQKMQACSKQDSDTWNPDKVIPYVRGWYRLYGEQHKDKWKGFGDYLAQLLKNFDGSNKEAALELGVHPSLLSRYLSGDRRPTEEFLNRVSAKFEVPYLILKGLLK